MNLMKLFYLAYDYNTIQQAHHTPLDLYHTRLLQSRLIS